MTFAYNVFLSHNSKDKPAVEAIANLLQQKYSLKCWLDKWNLVPGEPWQEALEEALDQCETVAVFVGPNSISPWENKEMRAALQTQALNKGRRVIPVLLPGAPDSQDLKLPMFLTQITWVDFRGGLHDEEALHRLCWGITGSKPEGYLTQEQKGGLPYVLETPRQPYSGLTISSPESKVGRLFSVPLLPKHHIPRLNDLQQIKDRILNRGTTTLAVIGQGTKTGIHGMGGIGKTVLAVSVARDNEIRKEFPHGVIWLTLGQDPNITARQSQIAEALGDKNRVFQDPQQGKLVLEKLFEEKSCLLILDDVWELSDVTAFDCLDKSSQMLITTRDAGIPASLSADVYTLGLLNETQSLQLLAEWAGQSLEDLPREAGEAAEECGYLPLALAMIGALVQRDAENWKRAIFRLRNADLDKIRQQFPDYPYTDLLRVLQVSIDAMPKDTQVRYLELAVFPEDTPIPLTTFITFWSAIGISEYDTKDIIDTFISRSLAQRDIQGNITLHDLQRDYVRRRVSNLEALHTQLLAAYKLRCTDDWSTGPNDDYFFQFLIYHLIKANRVRETFSTLLDFDWLNSKLMAVNVNSLMEDFEIALPFLANEFSFLMLYRAISLSCHILANDKYQLAGQLLGRMSNIQRPEIQALLNKSKPWHATSWLRPLKASLTPPSTPLIRALTGPDRWIVAFDLTKDGSNAIAATSNEVWHWDMKSFSGKCILSKSKIPIRSIAYSNENDKIILCGQGEVRSGSFQCAVSVLEIDSGEETVTTVVDSIDIFLNKTDDDCQIIAIDPDYQVKVINPFSGQEVNSLQMPLPANITYSLDFPQIIAISPDGRKLVFASADGEIRVWDLQTKLLLNTLEGHTEAVLSLAFTSDSSQVISASRDHTIKVWNMFTGHLLGELKGHESEVTIIQISHNNQYLASTSKDFTTRIWDLREYKPVGKFHGRSGSIAFTPDDNHVITTSENKSIRIWDLERIHNEEFEALNRSEHEGWINSIVSTSDKNTILTGSNDKHLKLWNIQNVIKEQSLGCELICERKEDSVIFDTEILQAKSLIALAEGDFIAVHELSEDNHINLVHFLYEIPVMAPVDKKMIYVVKSWTSSLSTTLDGKHIISACRDGYLRKWNPKEGKLESKFGHLLSINAYPKVVTITPDNKKIIAAYSDSQIRILDFDSGVIQKELSGSAESIMELAVSYDSKYLFSSSFDGKITMWDLETGNSEIIGQHAGIAYSIAVSPNNKFIATTSDDCTVKIWQIETKKVLATFYSDAALHTCIYHQNGQVLIAGDRLGYLHILRIEGLDKLIS